VGKGREMDSGEFEVRVGEVSKPVVGREGL